MRWTCARVAIGLLVGGGLVVLLSAGPVDVQERHGEVSREWARFDVFFGGGVNFVEDLGTPVTLDAGVTGWLWESWGGTWGAGGWFFAMPEANQGSLVLALRRGYSVGRRGHFQLGVGGVQARFGGEVEDRVSTGPYLEIMAGSGSRQAAWSMGWRMGRGVGGQFVVLARLFVG